MQKAVIKSRSSGRRAEDLASLARWRALSSALETTREDERRAIARELHDDSAQLLAAVRLDLNQLMNTGWDDRASANALMEAMDQRLVDAINSLRRLAVSLRPRALEEDGLFFALQGLRRDFASQHKIRCDLLAREEDLELPDDISTAVFRIVQEGLTNIARHANASRVVITLARSAERLSAAVEDDGCGICTTRPLREGALGLLGMEERVRALNGTLVIGSATPRGTRLDISLPLQ